MTRRPTISTLFPYTTLFRSRVAEQIKQEMGEILTKKIKDPRIGFVTVAEVEVTGDLQQATIYITVDRKSTRLNSSHVAISYAVFCLKKKHKPVERDSMKYMK